MREKRGKVENGREMWEGRQERGVEKGEKESGVCKRGKEEAWKRIKG